MNQNLSDYVFTAKYAKHTEGTRESYEQTVDRLLTMYPFVAGLREALLKKEVAPSMRSMQFGGPAIQEKNARMYNCTVSFCDRLSFFSSCFYLLLCGCGVGFSVQKHHVSKIPRLSKGEGEEVFIIPDSIEGWTASIRVLLDHYFMDAPFPLFDYSQIRAVGSPLRHGGKAPGSAPLKKAHNKIIEILENTTELSPIEAFDITMHLADAVISGGIRRSATIAIFSPDDEEMRTSKTGDWFTTNPHRARANISAMITPETPREVYDNLFRATKEFGEPGFIFSKSTEYINNPCVEITMCPVLIKKDGVIQERYTLDMFSDDEYTKESGWQFCNLTTINAEKHNDKDHFLQSVRYATIMGTIQASFTNMMDETTQAIVRRESLLGVSITGILANPKVLDWMAEGADLAKEVNKEWAKILGIAPASRITCVKPEGTASLVLETCAGIHPYYAPYFIRRVQANEYEDIYKLYSKYNESLCEDSVWNQGKVISFPCKAPAGAITDISDLDHLALAKRVNKEWVRRGTAIDRLEGANHNVSITVSVSDWDAVREYIWENREFFTGISLLQKDTTVYPQSPYEAISREQYHEMLAKEQRVDFSLFTEEEDNTEFTEGAQACAGGSCEII